MHLLSRTERHHDIFLRFISIRCNTTSTCDHNIYLVLFSAHLISNYMYLNSCSTENFSPRCSSAVWGGLNITLWGELFREGMREAQPHKNLFGSTPLKLSLNAGNALSNFCDMNPNYNCLP